MANPKITANLFSFKTFRSPDRIDEITKKSYLISHPDFSQSIFNQCPLPPAQGADLNTYFSQFTPATGYRQVRAISPQIYDFSFEIMELMKRGIDKPDATATIPAALTPALNLSLWDELFVQTATQKSTSARQACIQMIVANYYISNRALIDLNDLSKMVIVIPQEVISCFSRWRYANCGGKLFGVHNLGIQEYRRVEQTLCCYVPGEVSHIENIMAREYKEKSTRNLLRTEYSSEFSSETEIENLSDTTTTERNEVSREIAKELQKERSMDLSGSVSYSKDTKLFGKVVGNTSTGFNMSNSSSLADREAKNYAKEITERALERVVQKTSEKRTYKMIKEFEENNKHGFDNREGDKHVTGVYRWVDKIYDNQMVNYGRRLLFEITIPSPASFYKKAMEWKKKGEDERPTLEPPKPLSEFGISDAESIDSENAQNAASYYGASLSNFQNEVQFISVSFGKDTQHKDDLKTDQQESIIIPPGFVAERLDGSASVEWRANTGDPAEITLKFNSDYIHAGPYNGAKTTHSIVISKVLNPGIQGAIAFSVRYRKVFKYSGAFAVKCVSDPSLFGEWQETTLTALQQAYQKKLDEYNEELRLQQLAQEAQNDDESYSNPALNRLIEERELKRSCVEMMSKPYCHEMGQNFTSCKTYSCASDCGEVENVVTEVTQNEALEKYAEFIKFFETAFHWEIFSYTFFPYYYNPKCQWSELLQTKHDDPIFEAFLQSGMAKVLVPIRPQYERAVMWYLETGEIYTGENLIPEFEDDRYASLLADLDNQDEIVVEGKWQTRVPSTLTLIQENSTYLKDEQGLPCCDPNAEEDPEAVEVRLISSEERFLERLNGTSTNTEPEPSPEPEPEGGE